ncbi:MAG: thiosulfate oxidation carrier protein SoxY [Gemmatimonadales bacterium]
MSSNKTSRHADRDASGERSTSGVTSGATSVGRRGFLRAGVLAAAGLALSRPLLAEPVMAAARMTGSRGPDDEMIEAVRQLLKSKFGDRKIQYGHVQLDIPTDAPDGRAVPAIMDIDLPITRDSYVSAYYLMVDHNPDICLATYHLTAASGEGPIETRIKMRRTSYVRAIAEMNTGEVWTAATKVFVGLNGCG